MKLIERKKIRINNLRSRSQAIKRNNLLLILVFFSPNTLGFEAKLFEPIECL